MFQTLKRHPDTLTASLAIKDTLGLIADKR